MNTGKDKGSQRAKRSSRPGKQAETVAPAQAISKQATPAAETLSGFPIVGIGASAGGLAAFEAFFSGLPADIDPDMAFVLVQHLDPTHCWPTMGTSAQPTSSVASRQTSSPCLPQDAIGIIHIGRTDSPSLPH